MSDTVNYAEGYVPRSEYIPVSIYHEIYHKPHKGGCNWAHSILCIICHKVVGGTACKVCSECFPNHKHYYELDDYCNECNKKYGGDDV